MSTPNQGTPDQPAGSGSAANGHNEPVGAPEAEAGPPNPPAIPPAASVPGAAASQSDKPAEQSAPQAKEASSAQPPQQPEQEQPPQQTAAAEPEPPSPASGSAQVQPPGVQTPGGQAPAAPASEAPRSPAPRPMPDMKAAGIDGPTRSIARPEQVKDLPDLSELRHPTPPEKPGGLRIDGGGVEPQKSNAAAAATPPWHQSTPAEPQREPQSNLYRSGLPPVKGRLSTGGLGDSKTASPSRSVSEMAAKAARKEAAMVKSVGIDGPTRSIARPELIKDMPDLSDLRHPLPSAPLDSTGPQPIVQAAPLQSPFAPSPTSTGPIPVVVPGDEPLRTTVQVRRIDPWSMLKVSLVISVVLFFVWMIAVGMLYIVLDGMGVWDRLNNTFTDMVSDSSSDGLIGAGQVFGYAGLIGVINVVLFTALATIGSFIYNQCSDIVGGVQVTLADPD